MTVRGYRCIQGAEKLGFTPEKIPRNVKGCVDCGHCCHGCPYESKQSTQTALLEPLLLAGSGLDDSCGAGAGTGSGAGAGRGYRLQVIPHCAVSRVLYADGSTESVSGADGKAHSCYKRAVGVEATVRVFPDNFPEMSVKDRLHYIASGERVTRYNCITLLLASQRYLINLLFACRDLQNAVRQGETGSQHSRRYPHSGPAAALPARPPRHGRRQPDPAPGARGGRRVPRTGGMSCFPSIGASWGAYTRT